MKTLIYNTNFEKSDFLNGYIEELLNEKIKSNLSDEVISVQVWLKVENSFLKRGRDSYLCEIKMHTKTLGALFSKEKSGDCYDSAKIAINEVITILKKRMKGRDQRGRKLRHTFRRLGLGV
jgi:ribosome-associated translation inhibitor RaiA